MTKSIAIVGGGATGLSLANQVLLTMARGNYSNAITLTIYEKRAELGPGTAYAMDLPSNLMNTQVGPLDRGYGEGYGLLKFLKSNPALMVKFKLSSDNLENEFIPRPLFGLYLQSFAQHLKRLAAQNGSMLAFSQCEVRDICSTPATKKYLIQEVGGGEAEHDYVYLCVGHLESKKPDKYATNERYFNSCYPLGPLVSCIPKESSVGILGTRLSAIDIVIALKESGHLGAIHCVSRSGRLPAINSVTESHQPRILTRQRVERRRKKGMPVTLGWVANLLKAEVDLAEGRVFEVDAVLKTGLSSHESFAQEVMEAERHRPFQAAMHSLDELIGLIWNLIGARERRLFLDRYSSLWLSLWVSIPLVNGKKILKYLISGSVRVSGQAQGHHFNPGTAKFELIGPRKTLLAEVDYLVNAMGSPANLSECDDALMSNLRQKEILLSDPCGGVLLEPDSGAVVDPVSGKLNPRIYVLGPLTGGTYFLVTVLEFIERHAKERAARLGAMIELELESEKKMITTAAAV